MKFIFFSVDGTGFAVAYRLQQEGNTVIVAQVQDRKTLGNDEEPEDSETKRRRLSLYDGMLKKIPAEQVLKMAKNTKNKDKWFVAFDFNNMWKYSEAMLAMGYTNGFFPLKEDFELEKDRNKAKEFVKQHYPDLKVAEVKEFKSIEDGIKFLEETENIYVLKGIGDSGRTVVPDTNDPEQAKEQLIGVLQEEKTDYEQGGFILEQKIVDPIEFTPEIVFYNGEPVFTDVDFETKRKEAGDVGVQVGCGTNLVVRTDLKDKVTQMAFPPIVYETAKKRKGMYVMDASILYDGKNYYFGEFCPQRWGYDAFITELAMSGDPEGAKIASPYFEKVVKGINPLLYDFGTATRIFNPHKDDEGGKVREGVKVSWKDEASPDVWCYEIKKEKGELVSTGSSWDLAVITGFGDDILEAIDRCYEYVDMFNFESKDYRYKGDFLAEDYPTAIKKRYNAINHKLFDLPDWK